MKQGPCWADVDPPVYPDRQREPAYRKYCSNVRQWLWIYSAGNRQSICWIPGTQNHDSAQRLTRRFKGESKLAGRCTGQASASPTGEDRPPTTGPPAGPFTGPSTGRKCTTATRQAGTNLQDSLSNSQLSCKASPSPPHPTPFPPQPPAPPRHKTQRRQRVLERSPVCRRNRVCVSLPLLSISAPVTSSISHPAITTATSARHAGFPYRRQGRRRRHRPADAR